MNTILVSGPTGCGKSVWIKMTMVTLENHGYSCGQRMTVFEPTDAEIDRLVNESFEHGDYRFLFVEVRDGISSAMNIQFVGFCGAMDYMTAINGYADAEEVGKMQT